MKKLILGFCPVGNGESIEPFDEVFDLKQDVSKSLANVDAVVFWGGTDIHPSLYNEPRSRRSQAYEKPSQRDDFEWKVMKYCKLNDIPMIGVCRGAQMLCAFAGGRLVQHATGHNSGGHAMTTKNGEIIHTTSAHHQMLYPWDIEHEVLAWSSHNLSGTYLNGLDQEIDEDKMPCEPEVVWFPTVRGLAIQGHPEWVRRESDFAVYCNELVREYVLETVTAK